MENGKRNTAFLFIGAGIYLAIGHLLDFVSAGALVLALLGLSIVRSTADSNHRKDFSGYVLLGVSGLVLLAHHWTFLLGLAIAAVGWYLYRTRGRAMPEAGAEFATGAQYMKQHIVASIRWGRGGEAWTARGSELTVAIAEIQIDLTNAFFEGRDTTFLLQGLIGDIDIVVPEDVGVAVNANVALGEIQVAGERGAGVMNRLAWYSPNYATAEHRVQINVSYMIADVDVKVL